MDSLAISDGGKKNQCNFFWLESIEFTGGHFNKRQEKGARELRGKQKLLQGEIQPHLATVELKSLNTDNV